MTNHDPDFGKLCNDESETVCPHCGGSLPDDFTTGYPCPMCDDYVFAPPELPDYLQQAIGYMQLLIQTLEDNAADLHSGLLTANQMLLLGEALNRATADERNREAQNA